MKKPDHITIITDKEIKLGNRDITTLAILFDGKPVNPKAIIWTWKDNSKKENFYFESKSPPIKRDWVFQRGQIQKVVTKPLTGYSVTSGKTHEQRVFEYESLL